MDMTTRRPLRWTQALQIGLSVLLVIGLMACSSNGSNGENGNGNGPPGEDTDPPAVPSGLEGTSGDAEIELEWSSVSDSDLAGYNVYRATSSIGNISDRTPLNSSLLSEASFTDTDVSNGTKYYYRVTAVDENDNESDPSSEAEVTPFPSPPDRPD